MRNNYKVLLDIERHDIDEKLYQNTQEHDTLIHQKLQKMVQEYPNTKDVNYQIFAAGFIELINEWTLNWDYKENIFKYYPKSITFLTEFVKRNPHLKYDSFNPTIKRKTIEIQKSEIFDTFSEEYKKIVEQIEQFYTINDIVGINKSIERIIEWNENNKWLIEAVCKVLVKKEKYSIEEETLGPLMILVIAEKVRNDFLQKLFPKKQKTNQITQETKKIVENLFYKVSEKAKNELNGTIKLEKIISEISESVEILLENIRDFEPKKISTEEIPEEYIQEFEKLMLENIYVWGHGNKKEKWDLNKIIKKLEKSNITMEQEMWDYLRWLSQNHDHNEKWYNKAEIAK